LLPAALLASGIVVATAVSVLAATDPAGSSSVQSCGSGREWVSVHPQAEPAGAWLPAAGAARVPPTGASLTGCVDTDRLPDTSQPTDARG
jgi:hypothetical protein